MITLPPELIASFKKAVQEAFGRCLTDEEAQEYGSRLLETVALIIRIRSGATSHAAVNDAKRDWLDKN